MDRKGGIIIFNLSFSSPSRFQGKFIHHSNILPHSEMTEQTNLLKITMQSREIINTEIGEKHRCKANYAHYGHSFTSPAMDESGVKHCCIDKPCYQRPCLFWVPAPV
jgi:hypothetical protein